MTYILQIEAVNIYNAIGTTEQLSVRRGVSIAMRQLVIEICQGFQAISQLQNDDDFNIISKGGSVALIKIKENSQINDDIIKNIILKIYTAIYDENNHYLSAELKSIVKDLCFIVDYAKFRKDNQFYKARNEVTNKIRKQQLRLPSLSLVVASVVGQDICQHDGVLSAGSNIINEKRASELTKIRFDYGKKQKQNFILDEAFDNGDERKNITFTRDLAELVTLSDEFIKNINKGSIADKMAVITIDGNKFGSAKNGICLEKYKTFDQILVNARKAFLAELITWAKETPAMYIQEEEKQRLKIELLMWGGDEFSLVVPGCCGFAILHLFYTVMQNELTASKLQPFKFKKLTHAAGMVICSHKTRIDKAQQISNDLVEATKEFTREEDAYLPLLLESEEFLTELLPEYWIAHYGEQFIIKKNEEKIIPPIVVSKNVDSGKKNIYIKHESSLKDGLSMGQWRNVIYNFLKNTDNTDQKSLEEKIENALKGKENTEAWKKVKKSHQLFFQRSNKDNKAGPLSWIQFLEFLDYVQYAELSSAKSSTTLSELGG